MEYLAQWMPDALTNWQVGMLVAASFAGSFMTVAMGIGGGAFLLALMASLMPPAALIPVHGVIQIGSNLVRAGLMIRHMFWPPFAAFAGGTVLGIILGGSVAINLPPWVVQIGVGLFVIWSVMGRAPRWLSRWPAVTGAISSFLTMFFGATGVFVANFTRAQNLDRQAHVATHAVFMTLQHSLKVVAFGVLGFSFAPWIGLLVAMIAAGVIGTIIGRRVLIAMSDDAFRRALNILLLLISLRLIWSGLRGGLVW